MELKTNNKAIELVFTTRKIVSISNTLKGKNFEDLYFKALVENDIDALSKIIYTFAEDQENGAKAFKSSEDVYDFLDDYKKEANKSYKDIFTEIAGAINDEGFFKSKMNKKELEDKISNPLSAMNLNEALQQSVEKAITKVASEEVMKMA